MLKDLKSKRRLSLFVALALSAGGVLFSDFQYVYAADVSGQTQTFTTGSPIEIPGVLAAGAITSPTDPGNVTNNTLTLDGVYLRGYSFGGPRYLAGGYTAGTGNATGNTLIFRNNAFAYSYNAWNDSEFYVFGGYSQQGTATNNTVILDGATVGAFDYTILQGGGTGGADARTGNTLKVWKKNNGVLAFGNFEFVEFDLGTVNNGDTMLGAKNGATHSLDWEKIRVLNNTPWKSGGSRRVTLYSGAALTLDNYATTSVIDGNFEYGMSSNTLNTTSTVTATQIYYDRNQFKNADITYNAGNPLPAGVVSAGISTLGNTTTNNKLTIDGQVLNDRSVMGGYTQSATGDSTGNTIVVKNAIYTWSDGHVTGGTSHNGNATGNTVVLAGNNYSGGYDGMLRHTFVHGGWSDNPSADIRTGNKLQVQGKLNAAYSINGFEKMQFDLDANVNNGDLLLNVRSTAYGAQTFDWGDIKVTGLQDWATALDANNVNTPTLELYRGAGLTLNNYAPALVGIAGKYEFGKAADTASTGTVNVSVLAISGNRFQNVGHGVNVTTPGGAPYWVTYAGLSTYGNTTNHNELNLTGGNHPSAVAGYTVGQNGGSESNTLNLLAGSAVTYGTAGYTMGIHTLANPNDADHPELVDTTKNADVKNNTININGGTLNANGALYSGFIAVNPSLTAPNNVSAGDAKGNIVNIENGTFGTGTAIYGGYTQGTGKATGNIINIGKSDGTLNAPTLSNVAIYGGFGGSASDVVTDNTLNVNTNASVRNIANFGKVSFNFTSTFNQANPMLNVVGGAATDLNWDAIAYTGTAPVGRSILMQNMSNINLGATYMGAKLASLTDTHERVIDTNTGTGTAQQIYLDGYQFKSANVTPTTGSATEDVWAGRSVIGNTTTENVLTLNNGTTHRDAYGGWTAGTGTTKAAKDSSTDNTVNLVNSTVRNIYGGFTAAAGGNTTGNKVNISGGSVSGTVHGGYLSHASATGDATGNIVTITGGTMSDVYGGWTAGTGATTGNTVNLGSETDAVASGTTIGKLYGGSKTTATDNTLNVYDSVTAGNIANFDKVNFKATSSHIAAGDTLLTLNDGNATTLDWNKLHVDDLDSLTADPTSDRILTLMENSSNIDFGTSYSSTGTRGRIHTDDYEADMTTDGNSATTTKVYLKGYRFQNNDTSYAGTTATDAWGGRSIIGNKVQKNKLTLTGGSATLNARGGMVENSTVPGTTGDAEQNTLILNTGAAAANAYGAEVKTKAGSATKNEVTINAGTVNGTIYGAALTNAAATGNATENTVTITGGTMGDVYGGYTSGTGETTGNTVNLGDGQSAITATINGVLYGGNQTTVTDNTLNVKTNATAGNIAHFDKVKFHLNSTINPANSLLTLNNGAQTTDLNWNKLEVDTSSLTGAGIKTYEPYKLNLIDNAAHIATAGYTGAKDHSTDKFEYIIDTDSHGATATQYIMLEGYQFKDNDAASYTAADGTKTEAWAGRTKVGHTVENNTLKVTGGTINTAAYGGVVENNKLDAHGNPLQTGDATNNKLLLEGGTIQNGFGADVRTQAAELKENPKETLYLTGHSLGGAASLVTAARLADLGVPPEQLRVITFGAPAVGDERFARLYETKLHFTRIVMQADPVAAVLQSLGKGFVQFGEKIVWKPATREDRFHHEMALYFDESLRRYYDAVQTDSPHELFCGTPQELAGGLYIAAPSFDLPEALAQDVPYIERAVHDALDVRYAPTVFSTQGGTQESLFAAARAAGCKYVLVEHFSGNLLRERHGSFRLTLEEELYTSDGRLLTLESRSTNTGNLPAIEAFLYLSYKDSETRDAALGL